MTSIKQLKNTLRNTMNRSLEIKVCIGKKNKVITASDTSNINVRRCLKHAEEEGGNQLGDHPTPSSPIMINRPASCKYHQQILMTTGDDEVHNLIATTNHSPCNTLAPKAGLTPNTANSYQANREQVPSLNFSLSFSAFGFQITISTSFAC